MAQIDQKAKAIGLKIERSDSGMYGIIDPNPNPPGTTGEAILHTKPSMDRCAMTEVEAIRVLDCISELRRL